MKKQKHLLYLILSLFFVYVLMFFTFEQKDIFWYLYTFTMLVCMAISFLYGKVEDEVKTWEYLLFGIGYGTLTYGMIAFGHWALTKTFSGTNSSVEKFLEVYGPNALWHYILLILIIATGEELFWRGYIQQQLKKYMSTSLAILVASLLFALSLSFSGFLLGIIAAFFSGLLWGFLYEWKKSMPLIIVAHIVMIILLFLVLPLQ